MKALPLTAHAGEGVPGWEEVEAIALKPYVLLIHHPHFLRNEIK